jgi:hypothetical protein
MESFGSTTITYQLWKNLATGEFVWREVVEGSEVSSRFATEEEAKAWALPIADELSE